MATKKRGRRGQGEGSIYQRESDGKWTAVLNLGVKDGKRQRKVVYGETQAAVSAKLAELRVAKAKSQPIGDRETVGGFLANWLEHTAKPKVSISTHTSYLEVMKHLEPLFRIKLDDLTPEHVRRLMGDKLKDGLSPRRVAYIRSTLRAALSQAVRDGRLSRNVAKLVEPPKEERHEVQPLTAEQTQTLLETLKTRRAHEAYFTLMLTLGTRRAEALGLRWMDIDFDAGTIAIRQQLRRLTPAELERVRADPRVKVRAWITERDVLLDLKTSRSRRTLPLTPLVADVLRAHRDAQDGWRREAGDGWLGKHGLVFTNADGSCLHGPQVSQAWDRILVAAGLPKLRLHDARHGAGSLMLEAGVDLATVSKMLGHSSIVTTANVYVHVDQRGFAEAAGKLTALLGRKKP